MRSHKDVDFVAASGERQKHLKSFDEAAAMAVQWSMSNGSKAVVDILVYSENGARWLYGEYGVEMYREDPEASVFERIEIKANQVGRIP